MEIKELNKKPETESNPQLNEVYLQFSKLLIELRKRELPDAVVSTINTDIEELNSFSGPDPDLKKLVKKKQSKIISLLEKELKMVPKKYYSTIWMLLGMSAFGIPLGVVFGASLGNMAFLGIGLPIGLGVGSLVGMKMDAKALKEGRQLDFDYSS